MKTSVVSLSAILLVAAVSHPAHAARQTSLPKKTIAPTRTYSATEQEEPVPTAPAPQVIYATQAASAPAAAPAPRQANPLQAGFDPVPSDQVPALVKRLHLMEEIVRKYQRAYDYRSLTTRDLEAILSRLEAKNTKSETNPASLSAPAAPAAAPAAPNAAPAESEDPAMPAPPAAQPEAQET